jgi:cell division protein FtsN
MPKDYKDAPAPRSDSRVSHPLLLGMIIGLLMGVVISLAVALWLNRLSNPFVEKGRAQQQEAPTKLGSVPQATPPAEAARAAAEAAKPAKGAEESKPAKAAPKTDRPRFEFYQILPGDKEAPDKEGKAAPKAAVVPTPPAATTAAAKPGSSPNSPKPHTGETYWLQAGAFTEEKEADNLKAKIAFTGLEASVRTVNIPDRGTLYRVRLGPYQSLEDANRIKSALTQNGVGAAIIRATDEAKNQ